MVLHLPRGSCELQYFVTWLRPAENAIKLRFDHCVASLSCRPAENIEVRGLLDDRQVALLSAKHEGASSVYQAFYLEWAAFLGGVRNRCPSKFNARSALATVRAVESLYETGKRSG